VHTPRCRYPSIRELARALGVATTSIERYLNERGARGYTLRPLDERAYERWHRRVYDRWQAGDREGARKARI
jgi:hypothetical protein